MSAYSDFAQSSGSVQRTIFLFGRGLCRARSPIGVLSRTGSDFSQFPRYIAIGKGRGASRVGVLEWGDLLATWNGKDFWDSCLRTDVYQLHSSIHGYCSYFEGCCFTSLVSCCFCVGSVGMKRCCSWTWAFRFHFSLSCGPYQSSWERFYRLISSDLGELHS